MLAVTIGWMSKENRKDVSIGVNRLLQVNNNFRREIPELQPFLICNFV